MNKLEQLAQVMFPHITRTSDDYEAQYPERDLVEGQAVTRFAPSPTGFMHTGGLYTALINQFFAKQRNGVFYLRIEDTDQERYLENGISEITNTLKTFGIDFNEGQIDQINSTGDYGPYIQSQRKEIYQTFVKDLVRRGLAYPCFCSKEKLEEIHAEQVATKSSLLGYGGKYATCRNLSIDEAIERITAGEKFIVRFKAPETDYEQRIKVTDVVRGVLEMDANNIDAVILKTNGLPTYHFAHVIDDHLMRTTHVIRSDEWISSLPLHIQMFKALNFRVPKYAHVCPIMKMEGTTKRKLSKRKDPEARAGYYFEKGYPTTAVIEYLLNLINSTFEEWREKNPQKSYTDFNLKLSDMSVSGALFDQVKLDNVSKKIIKGMTDEQVLGEIMLWAKSQNQEFYDYIQNNREKFISSISIWHHNRMDIARWEQVETQYPYLYNDNFIDTLSLDNIDSNLPHAKKILVDYLATYDEKDEQSVWFDKMKSIAENYNYAPKPKDYKNNPDKFNGSVIEVSTLIRECLTGQKDSPDIYQISHFIGLEEMQKRINKIIDLMK